MSFTPNDIEIYQILRLCNNTSLKAIKSGSLEMKDIAARNGIIRHLNGLEWDDYKISTYVSCPENYVSSVLDYRRPQLQERRA